MPELQLYSSFRHWCLSVGETTQMWGKSWLGILSCVKATKGQRCTIISFSLIIQKEHGCRDLNQGYKVIEAGFQLCAANGVQMCWDTDTSHSCHWLSLGKRSLSIDLSVFYEYHHFLFLLWWKEVWKATSSCPESRIFKKQKNSRDRDRACGFRIGVIKTLECGDQFEVFSLGKVGLLLYFQNRGNVNLGLSESRAPGMVAGGQSLEGWRPGANELVQPDHNLKGGCTGNI